MDELARDFGNFIRCNYMPTRRGMARGHQITVDSHSITGEEKKYS